MSLETLAQKVGISKMTLHRIETGVSSPSIITLAEISYHLKQPLEALFQEGEAKVVVIKREAQEKLLNNEYGIPGRGAGRFDIRPDHHDLCLPG